MIELSVRKILLLYLRQHFSVTSFQNEEQRLSYMYKFLFCCLYPLQPTLDAFNNEIENKKANETSALTRLAVSRAFAPDAN